jgi:hypothetical protein
MKISKLTLHVLRLDRGDSIQYHFGDEYGSLTGKFVGKSTKKDPSRFLKL